MNDKVGRKSDLQHFLCLVYTRAFVFASLVLLVPGMVINAISTTIISSGGKLDTSGTLAKASGMIMILASKFLCVVDGVP